MPLHRLVTVCFLAAFALAKEPGLKEALDPSYEGFLEHPNRLQAKKDAFNNGMGSGSASRLKNAISRLKLMDKGMDKLDKRIAGLYVDYLRLKAIHDKEAAAFLRKYGEGGGVPVTSRTRAADEARGHWQKAVSAKRTEYAFQEWVLSRINEMMIVLRDEKRGAVISALASGTRDRDGRQRVRCADLLVGLAEKSAGDALARFAANEKDPLVASHAIQVAAQQRSEGFLEILKGHLDNPGWQARAAAVRALASVRTRESTQILIGRLDLEKGRLVEEILAALESLTGRRAEPDREAWTTWLSGQGDGWKPVSGSVLRRHASGPVRLYHVSTRSLRLIFCIDTSRRMLPAMRRVKYEVKKAIEALPDDTLFTVIAYADNVRSWKKTLQTAGPGARTSAQAFVDKLEAAGGSNTFAALNACLALAQPGSASADTVYFLAGSMPTMGAVDNPYQIKEEFERVNRLLALRFHVIDLSGDPRASFLEEIAGSSRGVYVGPPR